MKSTLLFFLFGNYTNSFQKKPIKSILFFLVLVAFSSATDNVQVSISQNQACIQNGMTETDLLAFFSAGKQFCTGPANADLLAESVVCQVVAILDTLGILNGGSTADLQNLLKEVAIDNPSVADLVPSDILS